MSTLDKGEAPAVRVGLTADHLYIELSDGREIGIPLSRFAFLRGASPEALAHWEIEPRGFAVYWPELGDGLEIRHLLDTNPL